MPIVKKTFWRIVLKILSLKGVNFQSYESLDLDFKDGSLCIVGPNMSGKTTSARLLSWVLTGKFPFPGLSSFTKDLVSPFGNSKIETIGELTFEVNSRDNSSVDVFKLIRRSSSDGTLIKLATLNNDYEWTADGAQEMVLNLAKVPFAPTLKDRIDLFMRSYWYGVGQPTSFFSAKGTERRKILESMDPSTKLSSMYNEACLKEKESSKELDIIKNNLSSLFGEAKARISDLLKSITSIKQLDEKILNYNFSELNNNEKLEYIDKLINHSLKVIESLEKSDEHEIQSLLDSIQKEEIKLKSYIPIIKQISAYEEELERLNKNNKKDKTIEDLNSINNSILNVKSIKKDLSDYYSLLHKDSSKLKDLSVLSLSINDTNAIIEEKRFEIDNIKINLQNSLQLSENTLNVLSNSIDNNDFYQNTLNILNIDLLSLTDEYKSKFKVDFDSKIIETINSTSSKIKNEIRSIEYKDNTLETHLLKTKNEINNISNFKEKIINEEAILLNAETELKLFYDSLVNIDNCAKVILTLNNSLEDEVTRVGEFENKIKNLNSFLDTFFNYFEITNNNTVFISDDFVDFIEKKKLISKLSFIFSEYANLMNSKDFRQVTETASPITYNFEDMGNFDVASFISLIKTSKNILISHKNEVETKIQRENEYEILLIGNIEANKTNLSNIKEKEKNYIKSLESIEEDNSDSFSSCEHCGNTLNKELLLEHLESFKNEKQQIEKCIDSLNSNLNSLKKSKMDLNSSLSLHSKLLFNFEALNKQMKESLSLVNYDITKDESHFYTEKMNNKSELNQFIQEYLEQIERKIHSINIDIESQANSLSSSKSTSEELKNLLTKALLKESADHDNLQLTNSEFYSKILGELNKSKNSLNYRKQELSKKSEAISLSIRKIAEIYSLCLLSIEFLGNKTTFHTILDNEISKISLTISGLEHKTNDLSVAIGNKREEVKSNLNKIIDSIDIELFSSFIDENSISIDSFFESLAKIIDCLESENYTDSLLHAEKTISITESLNETLNEFLVELESEQTSLNKFIISLENLESLIINLYKENKEVVEFKEDIILDKIKDLAESKKSLNKAKENILIKNYVMKVINEIEDLKFNISIINDKILELETTIESYQTLKGILSPNGDARTISMSDTASTLVKMTNEILSDMDLSHSIYVDIALEKGEDEQPALEISFVPGNGEKIGQKVKALPSESQRKIVGFIMDLSLKRLMNPNGFIIIDEPETGLDEVNRNKIMKFLKSASPQVFLITNTASSMFENVINTSEIRSTADKNNLLSYFEGQIGAKKDRSKKQDKGKHETIVDDGEI